MAPTWTVRSVLLAGTITLGMYLLLPYLETLSRTPERDTTLRSADTTVLPPPAQPPPPKIFEETQSQPDTPKPKLVMPQRTLSPLAAPMNLEMALGDIGGDFTIDFGVRGDDLAQQVRDMIFEIGDLDEPPRPLARLDPAYPTRARMRRIEGEVTVEFVVNPNGTVRNVEIIASQPGETFTESALRAIRSWRFTPGTKDGRAVPTRVRQKITFSL